MKTSHTCRYVSFKYLRSKHLNNFFIKMFKNHMRTWTEHHKMWTIVKRYSLNIVRRINQRYWFPSTPQFIWLPYEMKFSAWYIHASLDGLSSRFACFYNHYYCVWETIMFYSENILRLRFIDTQCLFKMCREHLIIQNFAGMTCVICYVEWKKIYNLTCWLMA